MAEKIRADPDFKPLPGVKQGCGPDAGCYNCGFCIASMTRLLFLLFLLPALAVADVPPPPPVAAKAWLLYDFTSAQAITSEKAQERIEPASLTKLMTAYLAFAALKQKTLALDRVVPVSERAWKASGSRMFIEPRKPVTVDELLHGMIVQSGNDACIAIAEAVAGSEEGFVQMMNREAQRLGMKNSNFTNSSGLPDPRHYSTAGDLGLLAVALIRDFPEYYPMYALREYRYNNITQQNRNRLLWLDPNVDGMKTGYTENAGFCLIASAKRGTRRLLSVVLGANSDGARAQESQKLLNYGFQFYDSVKLYDRGQAVSTLEVLKGGENRVKAGFQSDFYVSVPRGLAEQVKADLVSMQPLVAPISVGQKVGSIKLTLQNKPLGEYPVVALENVAIAGFLGRTWDGMRLWFK
jgi:D-alanyl-D-alanine carboxypeptidase (penicillin-binding protein 5/6)